MTDLKVINAPAGSGKTTEIKDRVREWTAARPKDKLLCITYTNRAADELKEEISSHHVHVSTIHSFFNGFSHSLFRAPEIVAYYFECYGDQIKERLENPSKKPHIDESNARYATEFGGSLTFDKIVGSVKQLEYSERPFNTLYRGRLSHDDLLSFITRAAKRFPAIYDRVGSKYQQIIIDEYQDTNVDVLEFFITAVQRSRSSLHLYGDRMQQIYRSNPVKFQGILSHFEVEKREITNYRSSEPIVALLNAIYNDDNLQQTSDAQEAAPRPRLHFTSSPEKTENQLADRETLILNIYNSSIFGSIGALELMKAVGDLPDHGYSSRYSAVDVLSEPDWMKVPNPLIRLLYGLIELKEQYDQQHYGSAIKLLRKNPQTFGAISLSSHRDKAHLGKQLDALFKVMGDAQSRIEQVIIQLAGLEFSSPMDSTMFLEHEDYKQLLDIPFAQVVSAFKFANSPRRSTQHGVKGESHDKVIFVAQNSTSTPVVHIKTLFHLWPQHDFNLRGLETFLADLTRAFRYAEDIVGVSVSTLKADTFSPLEPSITAQAQNISRQFSAIPIFTALYQSDYDKYLNSPRVSHAKKLFKLTPIEGLLAAYRLFYVGCSRARSQLDVIVPNDLVGSIESAAEKFEALGFETHRHP